MRIWIWRTTLEKQTLTNNIQILNTRPFSSQLSGGILFAAKNINIYGIMCI